MIINLRTRVNKVAPVDAVSGQFIIFDNCDQVTWDNPKVVDKQEFKRLRAYVGVEKTNDKLIHTMLKDPDLCKEDEEYHVNSLSWVDRVTKEKHFLLFDTVVFLTNDQNQPLRKING